MAISDVVVLQTSYDTAELRLQGRKANKSFKCCLSEGQGKYRKKTVTYPKGVVTSRGCICNDCSNCTPLFAVCACVWVDQLCQSVDLQAAGSSSVWTKESHNRYDCYPFSTHLSSKNWAKQDVWQSVKEILA